jgi:hypothetical protein
MSTLLRGGCLCGSIRFECRSEPVTAVFCHCPDCRRAHAAPYAACALMPSGSVALLSGEPVRYAVVADSGAVVFREFCGRCGTHLFSGSEAYPEQRTVKIAALDDPAAIAPVAHVWTKSSIPWAYTDDGLPRFTKQVEMAEIVRLWAEQRNGAGR